MNRRRFIQSATGLMAAASLDRLHAQDSRGDCRQIDSDEWRAPALLDLLGATT